MSGSGGWQCPRCGQPYGAEPDERGMLRCPSGHAAYSGFVAERAQLVARVEWLDARVLAGDPPPGAATARAYGVWPASSHPAAGPDAVPAASSLPAPVAEPGSGVQTLLLVVGAGLLVVAGIVFAAVVWDRLGAFGQVTVMALLTVGCGALALRMRDRLPGTAEALAAVAYGLAVIDVVAAPSLGLLPGSWVDLDQPYLVLAASGLGCLALVLGHRLTVSAWVWLGWATLAVATLLLWCLLHLSIAADQPWPGVTVCLMWLPAVALGAAPDLSPRLVADRAPLSAAGLLAAGSGGLCWLVAASDLSRSAFVGAAVALLVTAAAVGLVGVRVGWRSGVAAALAGAGVGVGLVALPDLDAPALGLISGAAGLVLLVGELIAGRRPAGLLGSAALWASWAVGYLALVGPDDAGDQAWLQLAGLAAVVSVVWFCVSWDAPTRPLAWAAALAGWSCWLLVLSSSDALPRAVETYFLPLAVLLLGAGLLVRRAPATGAPVGSVVWLAPAATAALVPPALACWLAPWVGDGGDEGRPEAVARLVVLLAVAVACVAVAVRLRWGGLLVPAVAALAIAGSAQVWTGLVALPRWIAIGSAGALLLLLGARLEWLRRQGRQARAYLDGLT